MGGEDHQEDESFADWVEYVKLLKKFMLEGLFPSGTSKKRKDKIRKAAQSGNYRIQGMTLFYTLKKGRVEKECQVIETQQERDKVMFANHSTPAAGHFAPRNTLKKISAIYYWKRMKEDITQYFNVHCQCRMPGRGKTVECDKCNEWFHSRRVRLPRGFKSGDSWMCAVCRQVVA